MVDLDCWLIYKIARRPLDARGKLIDTVSISMCHHAKSKYICGGPKPAQFNNLKTIDGYDIAQHEAESENAAE